MEKLGHAVHLGTRQEADARMVRDFIGFSDPSGNPIEIAWRPAMSGSRYRGTRDAGITGFSHIVLCTTDPVRDEAFWTQVCNARISDRIGDAALLRIDEVHHSIALSRPIVQASSTSFAALRGSFSYRGRAAVSAARYPCVLLHRVAGPRSSFPIPREPNRLHERRRL